MLQQLPRIDTSAGAGSVLPVAPTSPVVLAPSAPKHAGSPLPPALRWHFKDTEHLSHPLPPEHPKYS